MNVTEIEQQGVTYQSLGIPGSGHLTEIGKPQLPMISRFVGIPSGATANLEVVDFTFKELKGYMVYPAQEPLPDIQDASASAFAKDEQLYQQDTFYPSLTSSN